MADQTNMDDFFKAAYDNVKKLYEANDDDDRFETACLRLLSDPALPLTRRVLCCLMISRDFEHHRFYTQHGFETLNKIERLIQEGRVGDRLTPWINGTRTKFEEYQAEMKEALEEYEADKATKNVETGDKAPCDEGTEDGEIGEVEKVISSSTPAIKFSQEVSLAQGSTIQYVSSTEPTSIVSEHVERPSSPSVPPAVQQTEDDADMIFGGHKSYEYMTLDEQEVWRSSHPERSGTRMREEEVESDDEHAAKE